jgi:hypothetical protein
MARINIEDSLWSDDRFLRFCIRIGNEHLAVGHMVMAFRMAQRFWCPDRLPIPLDAWKEAGFPGAMAECRLVESREDGVYVRGSAGHFDWLVKRSEAGHKGGLAKASKAKQTQNLDSIPEISMTSSSSSSSSSSSKEQNKEEDSRDPKSRKRVSKFSDALEKIYQLYPLKKGKADGMKILEETIKTEEDLDAFGSAVLNYAQEVRREKTERKFMKHFSTFVGTRQIQRWRDYDYGDGPPPSPASSDSDLSLITTAEIDAEIEMGPNV